ncbi:MAG: hypothetical protein ACLT3G_07505 [Acutalibacteraceae bacterium]
MFYVYLKFTDHDQRAGAQNRLVMPLMATSKAAQGGAVTGDLCAYYAEARRAAASA